MFLLLTIVALTHGDRQLHRLTWYLGASPVSLLTSLMILVTGLDLDLIVDSFGHGLAMVHKWGYFILGMFQVTLLQLNDIDLVVVLFDLRSSVLQFGTCSLAYFVAMIETSSAQVAI